jgi:hypothetical protein
MGGVASNVLARMPLSWRLTSMRGVNVGLTHLMKTSAFQNLYLSQNKAHRDHEEGTEVAESLMAIPDGEGQQVTLFYSGGADSTYSAYLLAQKFDRVHLLTFAHEGISNTHKPQINADRLRERFGDKIVYHGVDGDDVWQRLYVEGFEQDRARYGAYVNSGACECCYLSWNAIAVVYNKRHNITNLAAGLDIDHSGFTYSAHDEGMEVMQRFHADYGIHFFVPIYEETHADHKLHDLGITEQRDTKRPYGFYTNHPTQAICELGLGHRLFAQHAVVKDSQEERLERGRTYFGDKLEICREYIAEALEQDLPINYLS